MKVMSKQVLIVFVILLVSRFAFADIFEYSKNVYGLDPAACQKEAQSLAKKISDATQGKIEAAYCAPLNNEGFDIRVLTDSHAKPDLELAVFAFRLIQYQYSGQKGPINKLYSVVSDAAVYSKVGDCLEALPAYESIFQTQTGLNPVSAQCARTSESRYVAQVDGFGKTHRHLYEANIDLGTGGSSKEGLLEVTDYLISLGATPVTTAPPSSFVHIKYFADSEIKFSSFDFDRKNIFIKPEECADALATVRPILVKLSPLKLVTFQCGFGLSSGYQQAASMSAIFDVSPSSELGLKLEVYTYGQFPSYAECRSQVHTHPDAYCAADIDIYGDFRGYSLNVIRPKSEADGVYRKM